MGTSRSYNGGGSSSQFAVLALPTNSPSPVLEIFMADPIVADPLLVSVIQADSPYPASGAVPEPEEMAEASPTVARKSAEEQERLFRT